MLRSSRRLKIVLISFVHDSFKVIPTAGTCFRLAMIAVKLVLPVVLFIAFLQLLILAFFISK